MIAHLLLALVVVLAASRIVGAVFVALRQPRVIGEMLAGILLGPSLLGRLAPQAQEFLLPASINAQLGVIAQVGVVSFMFLVGLELDLVNVRRAAREAFVVSLAGMVIPFALGAALALTALASLAPRTTSTALFAAFLGVAMSVTAFPVLARILVDRRMQKTRVGALALTSAALGDVAAWCLLALVAGLAKSGSVGSLWTVVMTIAFVVLMIVGVRPLAERIAAHRAKGGVETAIALVVIGVLASAAIAEAIGVHALFGAFLFGAIVPHDSELAKDLEARFTDVVVALLLPAFFAFSGLRTQLALVHGTTAWLSCGLVVLTASAGKIGGVFAAGRALGMPNRDAATLGALMNTRGLMELVVLNVGLDLGVISPAVFAMFVVMAIVTTLATAPLLALFGARRLVADASDDRARAP